LGRKNEESMGVWEYGSMGVWEYAALTLKLIYKKYKMRDVCLGFGNESFFQAFPYSHTPILPY
jgi:hypothetical protein